MMSLKTGAWKDARDGSNSSVGTEWSEWEMEWEMEWLWKTMRSLVVSEKKEVACSCGWFGT